MAQPSTASVTRVAGYLINELVHGKTPGQARAAAEQRYGMFRGFLTSELLFEADRVARDAVIAQNYVLRQIRQYERRTGKTIEQDIHPYQSLHGSLKIAESKVIQRLFPGDTVGIRVRVYGLDVRGYPVEFSMTYNVGPGVSLDDIRADALAQAPHLAQVESPIEGGVFTPVDVVITGGVWAPHEAPTRTL